MSMKGASLAARWEERVDRAFYKIGWAVSSPLGAVLSSDLTRKFHLARVLRRRVNFLMHKHFSPLRVFSKYYLLFTRK